MNMRSLLILEWEFAFLEMKSIKSRFRSVTLSLQAQSLRKLSPATTGGVNDSTLPHLNLCIQMLSRWTEFTST